MGDRGNIVVVQHPYKKKPSLLYFYAHWSGSQIPQILQTALQHHERWDDESYLARIIFAELVGDDKGSTGFGISAYLGDNSYPLLVVDCKGQTVGVADPERPFEPYRTLSFDDYCNLQGAALAKFRNDPAPAQG